MRRLPSARKPTLYKNVIASDGMHVPSRKRGINRRKLVLDCGHVLIQPCSARSAPRRAGCHACYEEFIAGEISSGADVKRIPLGCDAFVLVDAPDFTALTEWQWHLIPNGYAVRSGRKAEGQQRQNIFMHVQIMNPPSGFEVDHINGVKSDNRRSNLRICTVAENRCNQRKQRRPTRFPYKGVWLEANCKTRPYRGMIKHLNKWHSLGWYATPEEAARAYDQAALRLHGAFARLNFPKESQHESKIA